MIISKETKITLRTYVFDTEDEAKARHLELFLMGYHPVSELKYNIAGDVYEREYVNKEEVN